MSPHANDLTFELPSEKMAQRHREFPQSLKASIRDWNVMAPIILMRMSTLVIEKERINFD
jgi:hypothetical protein